MDLSNGLSCEAGSFSHCRLNPHQCFQSEVLRLYFPAVEPWVVWSVSVPTCSSSLSACKCGTACSSSCHVAGQLQPCLPHPTICHLAIRQLLPCLLRSSSQALPCRESSPPGCPSLPLLQVWMNVSSLMPCFSHFDTVQFSGSFG